LAPDNAGDLLQKDELREMASAEKTAVVNLHPMIQQ